MRTWSAQLFLLLLATNAVASAKSLKALESSAVDVLLAASSLGEPSALARLLNGEGEWRGDGGQFARLEVRFAEATPVSRIEIESCQAAFTGGVDILVNFDHTRIFAEGGQTKLTFAIAPDEKPLPVRSFVLNFRHNVDACVRKLRVMRGTKLLSLKVPSIIEAEGNLPTALFDSRPETTWALEDSGPFEIKFNSETEVTRVRVWNGDPRNAVHFKALPRVKAIALANENVSETIVLEDSASPQVIALKTPLKGKTLNVTILEAHRAPLAKAKLAELQFGNESGFFSPNISASFKATSESRKSGLRTSGLGKIVDRSLSHEDEGQPWAVRVRSDGSVFIKGESESLDRARGFSFLGRYIIVEANQKRVRLKVEGARFHSPMELDGAVCTAECAGGSGPSGKWIEDEISFGLSKDGLVFVRDEGPRRATGLDFHNFKARILENAE